MTHLGCMYAYIYNIYTTDSINRVIDDICDLGRPKFEVNLIVGSDQGQVGEMA